MADDDDLQRAFERLGRYLARRDHSELELKQKLRRFHAASSVEEAVARARRNRWLAEPEILAQRLSESLHLKGRGHNYIKNYLRKRGLPQIPLDFDREVEKGRQLLQTKFGKVDTFTYSEKPKVYRFLRNRGFDERTIWHVIYEKS